MAILKSLWRRISTLWRKEPEKPPIPNGLAHREYPPFVIAPLYGLGFMEPPHVGKPLLELSGHVFKLRHHVMRNGAPRFVETIQPGDFVFDADWLSDDNATPAE